MRGGAAGGSQFLLRDHPEEQAVCQRAWRCASNPPRTCPLRLSACELMSVTIKCSSFQFPCNVYPNVSRICPAPLRCNQQGSHFPPLSSSSSSWWLAVLLLLIGCLHWLLPSISREPTPLWRAGWLPWKHKELLLWPQAFYDISDERASGTSSELCPSAEWENVTLDE